MIFILILSCSPVFFLILSVLTVYCCHG